MPQLSSPLQQPQQTQMLQLPELRSKSASPRLHPSPSSAGAVSPTHGAPNISPPRRRSPHHSPPRPASGSGGTTYYARHTKGPHLQHQQVIISVMSPTPIVVKHSTSPTLPPINEEPPQLSQRSQAPTPHTSDSKRRLRDPINEPQYFSDSGDESDISSEGEEDDQQRQHSHRRPSRRRLFERTSSSASASVSQQHASQQAPSRTVTSESIREISSYVAATSIQKSPSLRSPLTSPSAQRSLQKATMTHDDDHSLIEETQSQEEEEFEDEQPTNAAHDADEEDESKFPWSQIKRAAEAEVSSDEEEEEEQSEVTGEQKVAESDAKDPAEDDDRMQDDEENDGEDEYSSDSDESMIESEYEITKIIAHRIVNGEYQYQCVWKSTDPHADTIDNTWETGGTLRESDVLKEYQLELAQYDRKVKEAEAEKEVAAVAKAKLDRERALTSARKKAAANAKLLTPIRASAASASSTPVKPISLLHTPAPLARVSSSSSRRSISGVSTGSSKQLLVPAPMLLTLNEAGQVVDYQLIESSSTPMTVPVELQLAPHQSPTPSILRTPTRVPTIIAATSGSHPASASASSSRKHASKAAGTKRTHTMTTDEDTSEAESHSHHSFAATTAPVSPAVRPTSAASTPMQTPKRQRTLSQQSSARTNQLHQQQQQQQRLPISPVYKPPTPHVLPHGVIVRHSIEASMYP